MPEFGNYKHCEKLFPLKTISQFLKNKKKTELQTLPEKQYEKRIQEKFMDFLLLSYQSITLHRHPPVSVKIENISVANILNNLKKKCSNYGINFDPIFKKLWPKNSSTKSET